MAGLFGPGQSFGNTKAETDVPRRDNPQGLPNEWGSAGLNMYAGNELKFEDHPVKFRNIQARARLLREMSLDPTIAGTLQAYTNVCRVCSWDVQEAKSKDTDGDFDDEKAQEAARFLRSCVEDMSMSMSDLVSQAMDMLTHGFNITIPVYKFRMGPHSENPKLRSRFTDKKIGWQTFKAIDPFSVYKWSCPRGEGYSNLEGIHQQTISGFKEFIPRSKFLLFRTTAKNDSPSGESILLGAIRPYEKMQVAENIEMVGLERNVEGIPHITLPSSYMSKNATPEQKQVTQYLKSAGASLKFNHQSYIMTPSDTDEKGNLLVDIKLMTTSGTARTEAARNIVESQQRLVSESLLSQFLKLGDSTGSYALSGDQTDLFILVLRTFMETIRDILNNEAVVELFKHNDEDFDMQYLPTLQFSGLEKDKTQALINALSQAALANLVVPSKEIQESILKRLGIPSGEAEREWDELSELQEKLQEQALNPPTPASGTSGSSV
jgi:hypothetical protein